MSCSDPYTFDDGKTWYVESGPAIGKFAAVGIPIDEIEGLSNAEIGKRVRKLIPLAVELVEYERELNRRREEKWQLEYEQRRKPKKNKPGFIYLVHAAGTPWYKIGKSINPKIRTNQLGTQGPFDHETIIIHEVSDMAKLEEYWHEEFKDKRANGEWFSLTEQDIERFVMWTE